MATIKAGVARLNPRSLYLFTQKLITRMTGNPNFANPQPALADIQTKLDEFETLAVAALDGTRRDRYVRDEAAKELKDMLRTLANYVAMTAAGNGNVILSSGFDIRNEAEPVPPVSVPGAVVAERSTHGGVVNLDWEVVSNTISYQVMMTTSDPSMADAVWTSVAVTSKSKAEVNNLTPGQYYWFRVKAVGRSSSSGFSDPAMIMAA
jgi:predicted phage tail protein